MGSNNVNVEDGIYIASQEDISILTAKQRERYSKAIVEHDFAPNPFGKYRDVIGKCGS